MNATMIFALAWGALILGHWANNKPTVNAKQVVEMGFALVFIALLDQGATRPIALGLAWLFFAAVLLRNDSILTGLSKLAAAKPAPKAVTPQTVTVL